MGMNFSPMYQPVSTKTIKADGDLNINPYDLLATDVKCDTVEATEFVGGVGNFTRLTPVTMESLTLDYTSLLNSAPNSIAVTRKGYSFTHSSYLSTGTYNVTVPYNKPTYTGLILLGNEDATFDTMSVTVSISISNNVSYGSIIAFYHNNVEVGRLNIPQNGRAASSTFTLPYEENIALTYTNVGGEGIYQPVITFADFNYYIIPYGQ